jgi:hypothetical protein
MFFIIIFTVFSPVFTEEVKTKADFIPKEAIEKPLIDYIPDNFNPRIGLGISSAAALSGITLLIINSYNTANYALTDPGGISLQQGIILSGTYLISISISMIFIDFFLDKLFSM